MPSPTVRISPFAHRELSKLSRQTGTSMQDVLDRAIDSYGRAHMLETLNQSYSALRRDPQAWRDELAERRLWERTLLDGLEVEPADPARPRSKRRKRTNS